MTTFTDIWEQHAPATMALMANATADYRTRKACGEGVCGAGPCGTGPLRSGISVIQSYPEDAAQVLPDARQRSPRIQLTLLNSDSTGLTPGEFREGDEITVQPRSGQTVRVFRLARIIKQDSGFVTVEVH